MNVVISENFIEVNSFDFVEKEIYSCLAHGEYFAALALALSIPDSFAKLMYGRGGKRNYAQWFDGNVHNSVGLLYSDEFYKQGGSVIFDGACCYQLRCSLFHDGSNDIAKKTDIAEFVLVMGKEPFVRGDVAGIKQDLHSTQTNGKVEKTRKYVYLSVVELVAGIVKSARDYMNRNPDKAKGLSKIMFNYGGGKTPAIFVNHESQKNEQK